METGSLNSGGKLCLLLGEAAIVGAIGEKAVNLELGAASTTCHGEYSHYDFYY